jgi:hypothetical protein
MLLPVESNSRLGRACCCCCRAAMVVRRLSFVILVAFRCRFAVITSNCISQYIEPKKLYRKKDIPRARDHQCLEPPVPRSPSESPFLVHPSSFVSLVNVFWRVVMVVVVLMVLPSRHRHPSRQKGREEKNQETQDADASWACSCRSRCL